MKTALIITGGSYHELDLETSYDYAIACDKGVGYALKMGITPDLILGDFDSYNGEIPDKFKEIETLTYPVEKDDTDTMLAIKEALKRGFSHILIVCALGNRMDHTIANIQSLHYIATHGGVGEIVSDSERIRTLSDREGCTEILPRSGYSLSLFSLTDCCSGLSISGAKYNVSDITLTNDFPLGHGNSIIEDKVRISLAKGVLLIIESKLD